MIIRKLLYNKYNPCAFICYKRQGDTYAKNIIHEGLIRKGYYAFLDRKNLKVGDVYPQKLEKNIRKAHNFIFLISKQSFETIKSQDDWVARELRTAIEYNKKIIPVVDKKAGGEIPSKDSLPDDLQHVLTRQTIDFNDEVVEPKKIIEEIVKNINKPWLNFVRVVSLVTLILSLLAITVITYKRIYPVPPPISDSDSFIPVPFQVSDSLKNTIDSTRTIPPPRLKPVQNKAKFNLENYIKAKNLDSLWNKAEALYPAIKNADRLGDDFNIALDYYKIIADELHQIGILNSDSVINDYKKGIDHYNSTNRKPALDYLRRTILQGGQYFKEK